MRGARGQPGMPARDGQPGGTGDMGGPGAPGKDGRTGPAGPAGDNGMRYNDVCSSKESCFAEYSRNSSEKKPLRGRAAITEVFIIKTKLRHHCMEFTIGSRFEYQYCY